jgi:rhodanese-related sulfurtransferase
MKDIKFITIDQLLEMTANNKKFKLVEVLEEKNYQQGHIPGAINIPVDKLEVNASKYLKKTDAIIVYCASYSCHASTNAAEILLSLGYDKTVDFKGGKQLWVDMGLELEK